MKRGQKLMDLPPFVKLITQLDASGNPHFYARNRQGIHVPIETMSVSDLAAAAQRWAPPMLKAAA